MPLSDNMRGAFLMMAAMATFTLNDTLVKAASASVPLFQLILIRGIVTTSVIALIAYNKGALNFDFSRRDWLLILFRTFGDICATVFFLLALFQMPIANVTAILQVMPLGITLAGAVFLGEKVGWRRYGAILIGFSGVMLIVRPGSEGFDFYSVYALISVGFVVVRDLTARQLSRSVPSLSVALINSAAITAMGAVMTVYLGWQPVSGQSFQIILGASGFLVAGYLLSVMAMRVGELAAVAPFRYTALLWAIGLGIAVFGNYPDRLTLLGSAIVVGMGLYTFYRERKLAARVQKAAI